MARIKNPSPPVKRRPLAFALMFVSFSIFALIILLIADYRSQGIGIFKNELTEVTITFEELEKRYGTLLTTLAGKRTPVTEYSLAVLDADYEALLPKISAITPAVPTSENSLYEKIVKRRQNISQLMSINKALQVEEIVGPMLVSYTACINKISYRQKASTILTSLKLCGQDLPLVQSSIETLPKAITTTCQLNAQPADIIEKNITAHSLFVEFYTLTSKSKAKEAAAVDKKYQKTVQENEKLPEWNSCITNYLQTSIDNLLK